MPISWARLASFCHLGFISDPLIFSKFHNETHDPKGQENKIYTRMKGREPSDQEHSDWIKMLTNGILQVNRIKLGGESSTLYSTLHVYSIPSFNPLPHRDAFKHFCKHSRPRSGSSCKSCLIRI